MNRSTLIVLAVACCTAVLLRFIPLPLWNFSALGALALLCGTAVRPVWLAVLIPLAVRAVTDLALEMRTGYGFYSGWMFDYGAYAMICLTGYFLQPRDLAAPLGGLVSATQFFLISNFGAWLYSHGGPGAYTRDVSGLLLCFVEGIPFFRGTLAGDLIFSCAFFAALHYAEASGRVAAASDASSGSDAGSDVGQAISAAHKS